MPFKNHLREFRARHQLTQEDLADRVGTSRQTIIAIEQGKYLPSLGLAFGLSKYLHASIEELFDKHSIV